MLLTSIAKSVTAAAAVVVTTSSLHSHGARSSELTKNIMPRSGGGSIICAGLSCLDLQLVGCTQSGSDEAIERYDEAIHCAGGSASMTATTLALLLKKQQLSTEEVHVITKIGPDFAGNTMLEFYRRAGASTRLVLSDESARTSMAVLPIFQTGKRACFVNLACNDSFTAGEMLQQVDQYFANDSQSALPPPPPPRAFLFGYPHLMPKMQGVALKSMLENVRMKLSLDDNKVLIAVDLNGVDGSDPTVAKAALIPALGEIDVLHLNEDEAMVLSSSSSATTGDSDGGTNRLISSELLSQISLFHEYGCAVVLLSLGSKGAFVSVTPDAKRLQQLSSPEYSMAMCQWDAGTQVHIPAFKIEHGIVNTNGAGDALFAGFSLAASSWGSKWKACPFTAGTFASLVAWQRCDSRTRDGEGMRGAEELVDMIHEKKLPAILED
jgi:sugar/nucleoside kinase (ribokinase family)